MSSLWKIKWTAKCTAFVRLGLNEHLSGARHKHEPIHSKSLLDAPTRSLDLDYLTLNASNKSLWNKSQNISKTWLYSLENMVGYSYFFSRTLWYFENCCSTQKKSQSKLCAGTRCVKKSCTYSSRGLLLCLVKLRKNRWHHGLTFGWPNRRKGRLIAAHV